MTTKASTAKGSRVLQWDVEGPNGAIDRVAVLVPQGAPQGARAFRFSLPFTVAARP